MIGLKIIFALLLFFAIGFYVGRASITTMTGDLYQIGGKLVKLIPPYTITNMDCSKDKNP